VDVNENNVTALVDATAYLPETDTRNITLGYYYRRKRIQERNDNANRRRKAVNELREGKKKKDIRRKIANIIVQVARQRCYAIVLEKLGDKPAEDVIEDVEDGQLRHRLYQATFRGMQKAIEKKAREWGVPVIYVDLKNTSKQCPIHGAKIEYDYKTRRGKCPAGGEAWHRDVAAVWNLLLRARGDGALLQGLAGGRGLSAVP